MDINDELILKVVRHLVGPIDPVADSAIDDKRMDNLKLLCKVVDKLLFDINRVSLKTDSQFGSVKGMAEYARKFLTDVKNAD